MKDKRKFINIGAVHARLKNYRDSIGKVTQHYHFSNEARLIHFAMYGRNKHSCEVNFLTRAKRKLYQRIICLNCQLIDEGVDYKLRKQVCRQTVENYKTRLST